MNALKAITQRNTCNSSRGWLRFTQAKSRSQKHGRALENAVVGLVRYHEAGGFREIVSASCASLVAAFEKVSCSSLKALVSSAKAREIFASATFGPVERARGFYGGISDG